MEKNKIEKVKRIYDVAKDLKLSSKALFRILKELNFPVKGPMSYVTEEMIGALNKKMEEEKALVKEEYDKKKKLIKDSLKTKESKRAEVKKETGKRKKEEEEATEIKESVKKTLAKIALGKSAEKKRYRAREKTTEIKGAEDRIIRINEFATVAELANAIGVSPSEVVGKCMELGLFVTINQRIDMDTIIAIADEFEYEVEELKEFGVTALEVEKEEPLLLTPRPPVVTVMGHVDHGKTSLLDRIRKSNIVEEEAGGITQHIGAYEVKVGGRSITFLDTPGHEAFTAMRARGAQVTDEVVLVVSATEGVMPQTVEAIDHAKAAGVPIIVAINKIDLPEANPMRVKQELMRGGVTIEEWGGHTLCVEVSAKKGLNIDKLLEAILLQAEMLELKADATKSAKGTVIEAKLDRGLGPVATILVQEGTLNIGDPFIAGIYDGKVRAMYNDRGLRISEAHPSQAVRIVGIGGVPQAGNSFIVIEDERKAKEIAWKRQQIKREQEVKPQKRVTLQSIHERIEVGEIRELPIIIKGDVDGSVEVLSDALFKIETEKVKIRVIHKGVGAITESDVLLAAASNAVIIGFHVRPDDRAKEVADRETVDIRLYNVIYEAIEEVKSALEGLLEPRFVETTNAKAEVRDVFRISNVGMVAGCYVVSGTLTRNTKVRLLRDNVVIYDGKVSSLRRFKEDVKEVGAGFECGVGLESFSDIKKGDILEAYYVEEQKQTL